jgi:hypothetical protein
MDGAQLPVLGKDPRFSQAVLDALPAQIAVLDRWGLIIAVNAAWRRFARDNGGSPELQAGLRLDYLAICRGALGEESEQVRAVADGVADVLERRAESFSLEYPCHAPDRERWFSVSVSPLGGLWGARWWSTSTCLLAGGRRTKRDRRGSARPRRRG